MLRVTIDSNLYVSAFKFGGRPMELVQRALEGEIEVAISQSIIDETLRILHDKFGFGPTQLEDTMVVIESCTTGVMPTQRLNVVPSDPRDNHILECAVEAGSEAVVTGDKDLLRMGSYEGIMMMTAAELLRQLAFQHKQITRP